MPHEYEVYLSRFRSLHPNWEIREWREKNITELHNLNPAIHEKLRIPAERSDILRIELLIRFGGVYLDTDIEAVRNFEDLIDGKALVVCELKPGGRLNNAFIASVPNHPALKRVLECTKPTDVFGLDKAGTGPWLLDRVLKSFNHTRLAPHYFYSQDLLEKKPRYGIDHAAGSWKTEEELRSDIKRLKLRIAELESQNLGSINKFYRRIQMRALGYVKKIQRLLSRIKYYTDRS